MTFDRDIAFLDLETTGVDIVTDRIIEIGVVVVLSSQALTAGSDWSKRFNPGIPIPAEATAVHGISDADVKDCPRFAEWAGRIWKGLQGRDLAGYNISRFDLALLDEEFRRCDFKLSLEGVRVFDACSIFKKKEPRTLEAAVEKYCGRKHEGAHGAAADAAAAADVLAHQLVCYPDLLEMTPDQLAAFCRDEDRNYADLGGKLYRDDAGDLRFAFGKNKDRRVMDERDYAAWMLRSEFPGSTKEALTEELSELWRGQTR